MQHFGFFTCCVNGWQKKRVFIHTYKNIKSILYYITCHLLDPTASLSSPWVDQWGPTVRFTTFTFMSLLHTHFVIADHLPYNVRGWVLRAFSTKTLLGRKHSDLMPTDSISTEIEEKKNPSLPLVMCGTLKQEVDTEEGEAALFDNTKWCKDTH